MRWFCGLGLPIDAAVFDETAESTCFPVASCVLRSSAGSVPTLQLAVEDLGLSGPLAPAAYHERCLASLQRLLGSAACPWTAAHDNGKEAAADGFGPFAASSLLTLSPAGGSTVLVCWAATTVRGTAGYAVVQVAQHAAGALPSSSDLANLRRAWLNLLRSAAIAPLPPRDNGCFCARDAEGRPQSYAVQAFQWRSGALVALQDPPLLPAASIEPCFASSRVTFPLSLVVQCRASVPSEAFADVLVALLLTLRHTGGRLVEVACVVKRRPLSSASETGRQEAHVIVLDAAVELQWDSADEAADDARAAMLDFSRSVTARVA